MKDPLNKQQKLGYRKRKVNRIQDKYKYSEAEEQREKDKTSKKKKKNRATWTKK